MTGLPVDRCPTCGLRPTWVDGGCEDCDRPVAVTDLALIHGAVRLAAEHREAS